MLIDRFCCFQLSHFATALFKAETRAVLQVLI